MNNQTYNAGRYDIRDIRKKMFRDFVDEVSIEVAMIMVAVLLGVLLALGV